MAAFSRHGPSAHPPAQCQDREGGRWLIVDTPDTLPTAGHSQGSGGSRGIGAHSKTLLVSRECCWRVWAGARTGGSWGWGGSGWGSCGCTGWCARGKPLLQPKAASFPPGFDAGRSIQVKCSSCASHAHAPTSGSTCLGSPEESRAGPGEREDFSADCISGKEGSFPWGVCAAGGGESQRKSQEREEGSGPSVRRARLEAGPGAKSHCRRAAWIA